MDKPFKTYDELIELMGSRGMATDKTTRFILEREGYYAVVNGYKDPFLESRNPDRFKDGTHFDELYTLFVMDRHLRNLLFRFITLAEATLKSVCTYRFCEVHPTDNEAYLDPAAYRTDGKFPALVRSYISDLTTLLGRNEARRPRYMRPYLEHYLKAHDNVPLWVLMNQLSLTQAFKFYSFQPESSRFHISKRFQALHDETHLSKQRITHEKLRRAYDHIKDFRNICAHDERLYCARVDKSLSTRFRNVMTDMQMVLTASQYQKLTSDVTRQLIEVGTRVHTIQREDILLSMGYSSMGELYSTP